ncbi:MAG: hypothetical protein H0W96_15375 [Solirubrobacterales bacterium]|nr:hypothetical protein [Solirubrobacterales bacterium]
MDRLDTIVWMDTNDPREGDWRMRSPADVLSAFALGNVAARPAAAPLVRPNPAETRGSGTVDAGTIDAGTANAGTANAGSERGHTERGY